MTGAILGGSSVEQAARLQMVIMFMLSACTALASIVTTALTLAVVVDGDHRIRIDRVDTRKHAVWRARDWALERAVVKGKHLWQTLKAAVGKGEGRTGDERRGLLE